MYYLRPSQRSIFWYITPCSPLKVTRRLGRTCRLHLQGRRMSRARTHQREAGRKQSLFLQHVHPQTLLALNRLHGVVYPRRQKTDLCVCFKKLSQNCLFRRGSKVQCCVVLCCVVQVRAGLQRLSQRILGSNTLVQGALASIFTRTPEKFFQDTIRTLQVGPH
jgi:hypothetical protein